MGGVVKAFTGGIGGLVGGALRTIIPGKAGQILGSIASGAVNLLSGNIPGAVSSLANLVTTFAPNNSFLGKVGRLAGLASSFMGNGGVSGFKNLFSGRLSELASNFRNIQNTAKFGFSALRNGNFNDAFSRIKSAFDLTQQFVRDAKQVRNQINNTYQLGNSLGNVFRG